ncbi:hypothetical protein VUR80DRAFT_4096 [Thermomyces stellatus]
MSIIGSLDFGSPPSAQEPCACSALRIPSPTPQEKKSLVLSVKSRVGDKSWCRSLPEGGVTVPQEKHECPRIPPSRAPPSSSGLLRASLRHSAGLRGGQEAEEDKIQACYPWRYPSFSHEPPLGAEDRCLLSGCGDHPHLINRAILSISSIQPAANFASRR